MACALRRGVRFRPPANRARPVSPTCRRRCTLIQVQSQDDPPSPRSPPHPSSRNGRRARRTALEREETGRLRLGSSKEANAGTSPLTELPVHAQLRKRKGFEALSVAKKRLPESSMASQSVESCLEQATQARIRVGDTGTHSGTIERALAIHSENGAGSTHTVSRSSRSFQQGTIQHNAWLDRNLSLRVPKNVGGSPIPADAELNLPEHPLDGRSSLQEVVDAREISFVHGTDQPIQQTVSFWTPAPTVELNANFRCPIRIRKLFLKRLCVLCIPETQVNAGSQLGSFTPPLKRQVQNRSAKGMFSILEGQNPGALHHGKRDAEFAVPLDEVRDPL